MTTPVDARLEPARGRVVVRLGALRLTLRPAIAIAAIYLAARIVTTIFLAVGAGIATRATGTEATIGSLAMRWDGQWYWVVGTAGYPVDLPLDAAGDVTQNAWAFMPLYPALSRRWHVAERCTGGGRSSGFVRVEGCTSDPSTIGICAKDAVAVPDTRQLMVATVRLLVGELSC